MHLFRIWYVYETCLTKRWISFEYTGGLCVWREDDEGTAGWIIMLPVNGSSKCMIPVHTSNPHPFHHKTLCFPITRSGDLSWKWKWNLINLVWLLSDSMDSTLPGFPAHGILQARILEWVAISFSRGSSRPRARTRVSCIAGGFFTFWAIIFLGCNRTEERGEGKDSRGVFIPLTQKCWAYQLSNN